MRGERGRGGIGCQGEKGAGPRGGGEGEQAGLLLGWLILSLSFPFSISFPIFQTKIPLNSNGT
jgi:hypothetical protein